MRILVDTSIWSETLRRHSPTEHAQKLIDMIAFDAVEIIGPIRQELLSGISDKKVFRNLKDHLSAFRDLPIFHDDYILAAEFYNTCRTHGVQGSHNDFLICSVAVNNDLCIYTSDKDFERYAKHIPVKLIA